MSFRVHQVLSTGVNKTVYGGGSGVSHGSRTSCNCECEKEQCESFHGSLGSEAVSYKQGLAARKLLKFASMVCICWRFGLSSRERIGPLGLEVGTGGSATFVYVLSRGDRGYPFAGYEWSRRIAEAIVGATVVENISRIRAVLIPTVTQIIRTENNQREALRKHLAGRKRSSREAFGEIGAPMLDEEER